MLTAAVANVRRFSEDANGTIAVIFSLTVFIVVMVTGLAIDFGRAVHASRKIGGAIDAAALAAAKALRIENLSDAEAIALAERFFQTNMASTGGNYAVIKSVNVSVNRSNGSVEIDVDADVPTMFGGVAGVHKIAVPKTAVAIFDAKDIEVGLQLDVTGSMRGQKLQDLKLAAGDLIDILLPDQPTDQKVRIGFAPFSAGVNAGPFARAVNGNRNSNGCTYERRTAGNEFTDALPSGNDALKTKSDLSNGAQDCPSATVLPITDDKALLRSTVQSYRDGGTTAGQLGTAWAWYLLSPGWATIWPSASEPAPYRDGKTIKVAILMTDGIYNTISGIHYGDNSRQAMEASQKARALCTNMKNAGIVVYTVGFQLGSASLPRQTLAECASSSENFFSADNGSELRAAFRSIAEQITSLRLSR
jgi:Flp pilus assembly protein TadG